MTNVSAVHRRRNQRGAAAVEFALLLPLMLLVIAGIVDFGRAFFTQIELTNAAREGARAAIINSYTIGDIQTRAATAAPGVTGFSAAVTLCAAAGGDAEVTASAPFDWIMLEPAMNIIGAGGSLPGTLSSKAVMRCGG